MKFYSTEALSLCIRSVALVCVALAAAPRTALSDDTNSAASEICASLESDAAGQIDSADRDAVKAFYATRGCSPVWVDERGPTRAARRAIGEIGRAAEWGLAAGDFAMPAVNQPMSNGRWSSQQTAAAEIEITAKVLEYAHQAQGGRIPKPDKLLSSYLDRQPILSSAAEIMAETTVSDSPDAVLRGYQPSQPQFLKLKALLATLRGKSTAVEAPQIPLAGKMLLRDMRDPDVAILKQRFHLASKAGDEQLFDESLEGAVRKFQQSAALGSDGIVGPMTRAALSGRQSGGDQPSKIAAVIANMEEWRWMPQDLGNTHVLVNIPSFSIVLTDKDRPVFEERVVVGTPSTQTPIFSKNMTTVVLRPPWILPDSIKLSALMSGRSLESQGFVVMRNGRQVDSRRVDWAKANFNAYSIYQPSGDDNALGLVKLLFPNKHSVYLHDTPSKYLFNEPVRLFSHGCMRVRNPQELAQKVLDIDRGAGSFDVKRLVRKGPLDNQFTLNTPIPVHVGYFTVWVDDDGHANYYSDYYGHQRRITLALAGKWNEIDVGADHLAAVDTSLLKLVHFGRDKKDAEDDDKEDGLDPPMGATSSFGVKYSRYSEGVGDIMRKSLGF